MWGYASRGTRRVAFSLDALPCSEPNIDSTTKPSARSANDFPPTTMEDTTMLGDPKGIFGESSFTLIPNGLSEDRLSQVRTMRIHY